MLGRGALLLFVVGTGPVAAAQAEIDEARAVAHAKRVFDAKLDTEDAFGARRSALRALRGVSPAAAVGALVDAYRVLDREAEPIAVERARVLLDGTSLELARFRKDLDPIRVLQDEALAVLAALTGPDAADAKLVALVEKRAVPLPFSLAMALSRDLGALSQGGLLAKSLEPSATAAERIPLLRVVAALGRRGATFASWAAARLGDESATVRLEAARTLRLCAARDGVEALVARLDQEKGRVLDEVVQALEEISGERFGREVGDWRRWLEAQRVKPTPPAESGTRATTPTAKTGAYFGIAQEGRSLLYVIDHSDSMARSVGGGGRRIDRCRRELAKALGELPAFARFNLVGFAMAVDVWQPQLVGATPENVAAARQWANKLDLKAGTSSYDALEHAFILAGGGPIDRFHELDVETLFFLSDGEPTRRTGGTMQPLVRDDPDRLLSAVRRWNVCGRVVVHAIGLGVSHQDALELLPQMAAQNGGRFVAVR